MLKHTDSLSVWHIAFIHFQVCYHLIKIMIKKIYTFITFWQCLDIFIHVFSNHVEWLRISANLIIIFWMLWSVLKSPNHFIALTSFGFNLLLNFIWLAMQNFELRLIFSILMTITLITTSYLLYYTFFRT